MMTDRLEGARVAATKELTEILIPMEEVGWNLSIVPEDKQKRISWGTFAAKLLAGYRERVWPQNEGLVNLRFGGDASEAARQIHERYDDLQPLADTLTGCGRSILATALYFRVPKSTLPISLDEAGPDDVDAIMPVSIDVSSRLHSGGLGDIDRVRKYNKGRGKRVYYTLHGGLETGSDVDKEEYSALAAKGLAHIINRYGRSFTLYLGENNTDKRALATYSRLGFVQADRKSMPDPTFGTVLPLIRRPGLKNLELAL